MNRFRLALLACVTEFTEGSYNLSATIDGVDPEPYLIQVSDTPFIHIAATPEPSSIALLGTGVLAVAGAFRRRIFN